MHKILALMIYLTTAVSAFAQEMTTESIPNSELYVSFPSEWTFSRPYLGNGKYSSIHVNLPKGDHGGTPMYPEFDFEFIGQESTDKKSDALRAIDLRVVLISDKEAKAFSDNPKVRYLHGDISHSYSELATTGYIIQINSGHLICTLTTSSKNENEHTKYISTLKDYCASAVESVRTSNSPNKPFKQDF